MSAKRRYYLVIKDINPNRNDYMFLQFCDRDKVDSTQHSLENIDHLTLQYRNKQELIDDMISLGIIENGNVDLFIVSPKSNDKLDFYELVFKPINQNECNRFVRINNAAHDRKISIEEPAIKMILDNFAHDMYYDNEYNNIVKFGYSNIYKSFSKYFEDRKGSKPNYQHKYKNGGWALKSYPLIRNIVDLSERYKKYKEIGNEPFEYSLDDYTKSNPGRRAIEKTALESIFSSYSKEREMLKQYLLVTTDKDYDPNQLSFDDCLEILEFESEEDAINFADNNVNDTDFDTKLTSVLSTFEKLPPKVFSQLDNGTKVFNKSVFISWENENDKEKLSYMLPSDLIILLDDYLMGLSKFRLYTTRVTDKSELVNNINHVKNKIYERLSGNMDELNTVYSWCLLYNKCSEYDSNYRRMLAQNNGKVYDKYGDFKNEGN